MKTFAEGDRVEVIRDTNYGRPWEPATYLHPKVLRGYDPILGACKGWHTVKLDWYSTIIHVPARRIRALKKA